MTPPSDKTWFQGTSPTRKQLARGVGFKVFAMNDWMGANDRTTAKTEVSTPIALELPELECRIGRGRCVLFWALNITLRNSKWSNGKQKLAGPLG